MTRVRIGVTEIGLKSEQSLGEGILAIGEIRGFSNTRFLGSGY